LAFHSGREADHSPPSSGEVKEWVELCLHSPTTPSWRGSQLGGHRDIFTFTFYLTKRTINYVTCTIWKTCVNMVRLQRIMFDIADKWSVLQPTAAQISTRWTLSWATWSHFQITELSGNRTRGISFI
jgi:hypothetical protein